jgi:hypothetical protein
MAGNDTAMPLQSVSGLSEVTPVAASKHISQRRHSALPWTMERHVKQLLQKIPGEAEMYWPIQGCETTNQEKEEIVVGGQIKESIHGSLCRDSSTNVHVLRSSFRGTLVL